MICVLEVRVRMMCCNGRRAERVQVPGSLKSVGCEGTNGVRKQLVASAGEAVIGECARRESALLQLLTLLPPTLSFHIEILVPFSAHVQIFALRVVIPSKRGDARQILRTCLAPQSEGNIRLLRPYWVASVVKPKSPRLSRILVLW